MKIIQTTQVILTLCIGNLFAQPTITSLSPTSGPVGTTVIITGTGFDTTPANNIVFFGATQAIVSTATATELAVTVPTGATYMPITVLVDGLLAYSSAPFVVTFVDSGIYANSFDTKLDYTTGEGPHSVSIGDLDGDGKADLVLANRYSNTLSILRNTSPSAGTISYASKVDYTTGDSPWSVSIGDLDGDGKSDLAVTNSGASTISVFRNTSSNAGTISYDTKVDYATGTSPNSVSIGDLDGDGKADLVVTNAGFNTVSVLRNTGTITGTISYATKVDLITVSGPYSVTIGDLDGDGKADLAVANINSNTVSVFRNTSPSSGSINYATKVDFTTGEGPRSVAIGDLDGDGKADMAVTNGYSNTVSVFRNTSPNVGTINYAAKVDYTTGSFPFSIALGDLDGDGKVDLAVSNWGSQTVSVFKNTSPSAGTISYNPKVDYSTGIGPNSVSIGDLDGDSKVDLAVANLNNNTVSILKNAISSPEIETDITSFSFIDQTGVATIDAINHTIDIEVNFDTDFTALIAAYTLSTGANAQVSTTEQVSGTTTNDFTSFVTYSITAEDGVTSQDWLVTVTNALNSATDFTTFSFSEQSGAATIDAVNHTVEIEVEYETDISALIASFTMSDAATTEVKDVIQVGGVTINDFNSPVIYTIIAEDGATSQDWIINVSLAASNESDVITYSFEQQTEAATIDGTNRTINIEVANDTDISSLISTFTLSDGAIAKVGDIEQESGVTINDFTSSIIYTITAEDGITTQDWTLLVQRSLITGIDNIQTTARLYPNPVINDLYIETSNSCSSCSVSILSLNGVILLSQDLNSNKSSIDLSGLKNGIYLIQIFDDSNITNSKLVLKQ